MIACNTVFGIEDVKLGDQGKRTNRPDGTSGGTDDNPVGGTDENPPGGPDPIGEECTGTCATAITLGRNHGCALVNDGKVRCWGANTLKQTGATGTVTTKPAVVAGVEKVKDISAGLNHTCAMVEGGKVFCWGDNTYGIVTGVATASAGAAPTEVKFPAAVAKVYAGSDHQCATLTNDDLYCWGRNDDGQVGVATPDVILTPQKVLTGVKGFGGSDDNSCALLATGQVSCWGRNSAGNLARGTSDFDPHPDPQIVAGIKAVQVGNGNGVHVGVVLDNGKVALWGSNARASIRITTDTPTATTAPFTPDSVADVAEIAPGLYFTCVRSKSGDVQCWGSNTDGIANTSDASVQNTPLLIDGVKKAAQLAAGDSFACANVSGKILCWGANDEGQLGRGATSASETKPVALTL